MIVTIAENFEYAGEFLNDKGYIICSPDTSGGFDTISSDSQRSFNTQSLFNGKLFELTNTVYEDRIEITFCICKHSCQSPNPTPITVPESRELKRWLNRPEFHRFKLIQPDWSDIYMEGSFNVKNVECMGKVYMLELTFISNRPFALHEPITYNFTTSASDKKFTIFDISDEIGHIYPDIEIKCLKAGNLEILNSNENRTTIIKNCKEGEIITFTQELLMKTSSSSHKIQNDFNYQFLRISNSYLNRKNTLTFSIPVQVSLQYTPYVKAVS